MAGADDEIIWSLTGNDDLIATGLALEDDDDTHEDTAALFGINISRGSTPIDLDDNGDGAMAGIGMPIGSNSTDGHIAFIHW